MHDTATGIADKFAGLFEIARQNFADAFSDTNVALLAQLKHDDPARYQALRQAWRDQEFPAQTDLNKAVDQALAGAKRRAKQRKSAADEGANDSALNIDDPRTAARAFVADIRPNLIHNNGSWLDYRGNCYHELEPNHVRSDVWAYLGSRELHRRGKPIHPDASMVSGVVDALTGLCFRERQAFAPPAWLDKSRDDPAAHEMIACNDCLLHISTGKVIGLTPRFFTFNGLSYAYEDPDFDPGPTEWLAFLNGLFPDAPENIAALQEIFGYLLTNDTSQQKIFLIVGPPRSGKGTIGRVLTAMLGKDNCTSPSLKALGKDFGMESLIGKQLMLVSDMRLSRNADSGEITGNILRVSGEDDVNVSRKFKSDWVGKLSTRLLFLSNVPLILPDMSGALVNRIVPLVLKKSFLGEEDTKLTDRLLAELPSILNWSIEGWKRLSARGHFELTPQGSELNNYASSHAAPVQAFLNVCCETGPGFRAPKQRVFDAFRVWAMENDVVRQINQAHFGREMLIASGYTIETSRPRDNGKQVPHFVGLRLKQDWDRRADEARALPFDYD